MPDSTIINSKQLREMTGLRRSADIQRKLEEQGIACFRGNNGPWTTLELIKIAGMARMGLEPKERRSKRQWL
ncbi:MAG: hypothetical protein WEB57_00465 [Pseudohongiellaceae bacterium]